MKKLILLFIFITTFSFSNNVIKWHSIDEFEKLKNTVKFGDIIIYEPLNNRIFSIFGHIVFISENNKIVDFPNSSSGFREFPLEQIKEDLHNNRKFIVLRYKYMNDNIKEKMLNLIDNEFLYKKYFLITPPTSNTLTTYCSHFIWDIYRRTVGDVLEHNSNFITPLSFLKADKYFEIVDF